VIGQKPTGKLTADELAEIHRVLAGQAPDVDEDAELAAFLAAEAKALNPTDKLVAEVVLGRNEGKI